MEERYTRTAMTLHWLIALAVLGQIAFGWYLQLIPRGAPDRTVFVNFPKSTRLVIGLLIVIHLLWRLTHTPPPLPEPRPAWRRRAPRVNHALPSVCMLLLHAAGYTATH